MGVSPLLTGPDVPFGPCAVPWKPYLFPPLGCGRRQEAAARLVHACRAAGGWVGIPYGDLADVLAAEIADEAAGRPRDHHGSVAVERRSPQPLLDGLIGLEADGFVRIDRDEGRPSVIHVLPALKRAALGNRSVRHPAIA